MIKNYREFSKTIGKILALTSIENRDFVLDRLSGIIKFAESCEREKTLAFAADVLEARSKEEHGRQANILIDMAHHFRKIAQDKT